MPNRYALQREVLEDACKLIFDAVHDGGATSRLPGYKRRLDDVQRRFPSLFSTDEFKNFAKIGEEVGLKALDDQTLDNEPRSTTDAAEDWLLAEYENVCNRLKSL